MITRLLEDFGEWLFAEAPWAAIQQSESRKIDERIANAVATNNPATVARTINAIKFELELVNLAYEMM